MNTLEPGRRYREKTAARQRVQRTSADSAALANPVDSEAFRNRDPETINRFLRISFRSTFADRSRADELVIDLDGGRSHAAPAARLGR